MLFSIVIPTYNRLALLQSTLESVWAQTDLDGEVIVVDDGSTDGTPGHLSSLGNKVRVLKQSNRGPGAARNAGVAIARGKYIAFLDSDDVWFPWSLETYAAIIREHDSPSFIAGRPFRFDHGQQLGTASSGPVKSARFVDYLGSGDEWRWWGVSSFVIRADALREAGGFVETNINGEDGDLAMKLGVAPGFVQVDSPVTFGYREHGSNVTNDLSKSLAGVRHKIQSERAGAYPGGKSRAIERCTILTRHVRPVALALLKQSSASEAWQLYRSTLRWHIALGRWKFIAGFPLKALFSKA